MLHCYIMQIYISLLQQDINEMITVWNTHCIRPTKNQNVPSGRPCTMYAIPLVYGTHDYAVEVENHAVTACKDECLLNQDKPSDSDLHELFNILMEEHQLERDMDAYRVLDIYNMLRPIIWQEINN